MADVDRWLDLQRQRWEDEDCGEERDIYSADDEADDENRDDLKRDDREGGEV